MPSGAHKSLSGRRRVAASAILLAFDQITKAAAFRGLDGQRIEPIEGWGLTSIVNPGTWLWPQATTAELIIVHSLGAAVWVAALAAVAWYERNYRSSVAVDWAFAFLTLSTFGNLIDRVVVGGARDWVITPIAVGNVADVAWVPAVALVLWEPWRHPPARRLLSLNPRRWRPE